MGSDDGRAGVYRQPICLRPIIAAVDSDEARPSFFAATRSYRMQNPAAHCRSNRVESDEPGLQHVRFDQVVTCVPVFGGQLIVHLQAIAIVAVNGDYFPGCAG